MFCVILALRRSGKPYVLRPTDIYRQSLITSATATNRIDRASECGLVRRLPDPNDRRGILVELTAAGKALADRKICQIAVGAGTSKRGGDTSVPSRLKEMRILMLTLSSGSTPSQTFEHTPTRSRNGAVRS